MRPRRFRHVWVLAVCCGGAGIAAAEQKPIWLAVTRPRLAGPLDALARNRRTEGMEAIVSMAAVQKTIAALAFAPLPAPPDAGPWAGTVARPGWLRLVATGGGEIHVAVLKLP